MKRLLPIVLSLLLVPAARAVQLGIMIQGYLTDPTGTPYTTPQTAEFKLYQGGSAQSAGSGTLVFDETGNVTPAASGVFNYVLGSGKTVSGALSVSAFDTDKPLFVEITVAGSVLLPRLQLTGLPFAAVAGVAEALKPVDQVTASTITAIAGTFTTVTTSSGITVQSGGVSAPSFTGSFAGDGSRLSNIPGGAPIGSLVAYAGTAEPAGWIECDGRSVPQTGTASASWGSFNPAALFSAIGTVWGSAGAGAFNIPDMRGIFPRGWNHGKMGAFSDPDASARVAQYTSGVTGDAIGSYQVDELKSHTHGIPNPYTYGLGSGPFPYGAGGSTQSQSAGGAETRPRNASVMYLIRVQ